MKLPGVGDTLGSKYRLDHVIGRGGFATVYRATDVRIDREVAVKVLTPGETGYKVATASRFQREARALASLSDPHTIRMFDFGRTDDGVLYMVFELLGGVDLSQHLSVTRTMDEESTVHIVEQVLQSLREAHAAGILHRDIKPGNIRIYEYLDDPLAVKLMDFGIIRLMDPEAESLTGTGLVVGTVRYMSPEQLKGKTLTPASDIFSLGLVAYEMLTGDKRGALDLVGGGQELSVPASPPIARIINRMLRKDPDERFRGADEVLAALATRDLASQADTVEQRMMFEEQLPPTTETPLASVSRSADVISVTTTSSDEYRPTQKQAVVIGLIVIAVTVGAAAAMLITLNQDSDGATDDEDPGARALSPGLVRPEGSPPRAVDPPDGAPDVDTQTAAPVPANGCGRTPEKVGVLRSDAQLIGLRREEWRTYIPIGYDAQKRHPLLVFFHADASTITAGLRSQTLRPFADEKGFVIVAPKNDDVVAFRDGVDPEMVKQIVDATRRDLCIDDDQIFAYGVGGGGGGVESISCKDWVRAVASTSWRYNEVADVCPERRPVPILYYAQHKSKYLPIKGGLTCGGYEHLISLADQEALFRERNGCREPKSVWRSHGEHTCYEWDCDQAFVSCHIEAGHNWKGFKRDVDVLGCDGPAADFPHREVMWDFFQRVVRADTRRPDDR